MNHTRLSKEFSPTPPSKSGQTKYKGWSCVTPSDRPSHDLTPVLENTATKTKTHCRCPEYPSQQDQFGVLGAAVPEGKSLYTITHCSSFTLTCSLRYVKLLTGYGGKFRPRTGHEGPERELRCIPTLSLTSALDGVGWSAPRPSRSSNHTVFTSCLLIYLFLSEVQRLKLFS
jgi:hypothetical protein